MQRNVEAKLHIILGRTGDIMAALPIVQHDAAQGLRPCVMVNREFANVLDGVSLDCITWDGDWRHVRAAYNHALPDWKEIVVLQQYSTDGWPQWNGTDSFVKEMYRVASKLHLFPLPLHFDRRDPEREAKIVASLPTDKPLVLVATTGLSSPFPHRDALLTLLERTFPQAVVFDMDTVRGERIYDLLALFERAACLVTMDSALLHLAQATPQLPVIALIADRPTKWHGSPAYAGQRLRIPYSHYEHRKADLLAEVGACVLAAVPVKSQ